MLKLIILVAITIGSYQVLANETDTSVSRKIHFKHHGLWHHHGLMHYWVFLAIKAKIIFLIGTFISFWLFAGKAFAFLYYVHRKDKCNCDDYHGKFFFDGVPDFEHKVFKLGPAPPNFLQHKNYNRPLPLQQQKYSTIKDPNLSSYGGPTSTFQSYARSFENSFFGNMKSMLNKVDLTETAFEAMDLKDEACKKRFVCETDLSSKDNSLLAFSVHLFSDIGLMKYRNNSTTQDCISLGPHCSDT